MFRSALLAAKCNASTLCITRRHRIAFQDSTPYRRHFLPLLYNEPKYMTRKKEFRARSTTTQDKKSVDTLIIGGGPIGASTAFHLAKQRIDDDPFILVVERDITFQSGSAIYSAGGIRLQFSLGENVRMSLYGIDFLRNTQSALYSNIVVDPFVTSRHSIRRKWILVFGIQ